MGRRGCIICGETRTIEATDNRGNKYQGCPNCRIKSLAEIEAMGSPMASDSPNPPMPLADAIARLRGHTRQPRPSRFDSRDREALSVVLDGVEKMRAALVDIAEYPRCQYKDGQADSMQYRSGIEDGHRCSAGVARDALAAYDAGTKP